MSSLTPLSVILLTDTICFPFSFFIFIPSGMSSINSKFTNLSLSLFITTVYSISSPIADTVSPLDVFWITLLSSPGGSTSSICTSSIADDCSSSALSLFSIALFMYSPPTWSFSINSVISTW